MSERTPREHVDYMLKNYQHLVRLIKEQTEFLERYEPVTPDEMLELMSFGHSEGAKVQSSAIPCQPARIADNYRKITRAVNIDVYRMVVRECLSSPECWCKFVTSRLVV